NIATTDPTMNVVIEPTSVYHGHATRLANATYDTTAMPVRIRANARVPPPLREAPRRKTPRIGPLIREAIERTVLSADFAVRSIATPTAICTIPAITVIHFETFR